MFKKYNHFIPGITELIWLCIFFLIGILLGSIVLLALQFGVSPEFATRYGTVITYPIQFIPMMIYARSCSRRNEAFEKGIPVDSHNFGRLKGWSMALIVSAMAVAGAFVTEPVSMLLPEMSEEMKRAMEMLLDGPLWVVLLSVSVFAPLFEEWLCRGMILRGLLTKMKPSWAIVISSLVFGLIHMNLWQAIPAFLIGCMFGYVYYRTGSLKLTILMHSVNNTLSVIVSRIPGLEEAEFFADVMSTWAYILVIIAFASVLASGLIIVSSTSSQLGPKSQACPHPAD